MPVFNRTKYFSQKLSIAFGTVSMLASQGVADHHTGRAEELTALSEGEYMGQRHYPRFCLQEPKTIALLA